jgi:uncharacterized protein YbcI
LLPADPLGCRALVGSPRNSSLRAYRLTKRGGNRSVWRFAVSPREALPAPATGQTLAQISTGLVQLHSRYYGKGPTKAKTHLVDDTVVSILRGGFTRVEETLVETGKLESVYQMRRSFQEAMGTEFRRVVEEATGRKVLAYMSSIHVDPDLAVEVFVLEPLDGSDGDASIRTEMDVSLDGHADGDGDGAGPT